MPCSNLSRLSFSYAVASRDAIRRTSRRTASCLRNVSLLAIAVSCNNHGCCTQERITITAPLTGRTASYDTVSRPFYRGSNDDEGPSVRGGRAGGPGSVRGSGGAAPPPPPAKRRRAVKFKHVRINRMHARVNYEGYPVSITDFGLVLDTRVYTKMAGSWKTLLNR